MDSGGRKVFARTDSLPQLLVDASAHPCPYLLDRTAILPMRLPLRRLTPAEMDERLQRGDRRQGVLLYRPECPTCNDCTPIRLDIGTFVASKTMLRAWRVGGRRLTVALDRPQVNAERVELYNRHRRLRDLDQGDGEVSAGEYGSFLVDSCCDSWELSYREEGRLVGIAIFDRAATSLSAVYCCYDPSVAGLSLGVFSVLQQVELCRQWQLRWLYLGYWVSNCRAMRYKATYLPHELLRDGQWQSKVP